MADDIFKAVLGSEFKKKIDKLEKQQNDISDEVFDTDEKVTKLSQLISLKQSSEKTGKALGSQEALGLMESIRSSVILQTQKAQGAIMKTFLPVDVELKHVIDLLSSQNEEANDLGIERMEKLADALKIDFKDLATAMGASVKDLINARQFQKEDREENERIIEQTKTQLLEKRDQLREQNINTVLNEKTMMLELRTKSQEKQDLKEIALKEKELQTKHYDNLILQKQLQKQDIITEEQQTKFIQAKNEELAKEKEILELKEKANIKPDQKVQGLFSQTYGAMFGEGKRLFQEIKQMGGGILKGFKGIPGMFGSLGKGLGAVTSGLMTFLRPIMIGVLVFGLIVLAVFALIKLFQKLKTIWPFSLFGDKDKANNDVEKQKQSVENKQDAEANKLNNEQSSDQKSSTTMPEQSAKIASTQTGKDNEGFKFTEETSPTGEQGSKIQPLNYKEGVSPKSGLKRLAPSSNENLNQLSTDLMASSQNMGSKIVSAPTQNTVVNNNNTTQSLSIAPPNTDRSFINLNTVPV